MVKPTSSFFKAGWLTTVVTFASASLFLWLGSWQLRRAEEKQALLDQQSSQQQRPAKVLQGEESLKELGRYRRVIVKGVWDPAHQFLLDNRTSHGRVGYEVLTPLEIDGGSVVLVNRGWVASSGKREQLPDLTLLRRYVRVSGRVDPFPQMGMHLEGMRKPTAGWPAVVQELVPEVAAGRLKQRVLDFQVKMDPDQEAGYQRAWQLDYIKPQRHIGYALQWFTFAAIAVGLWVWFGFKHAREQTSVG